MTVRAVLRRLRRPDSWRNLPVPPEPDHRSGPPAGGSRFASTAGFSLVEVLAVLSILSLILTGLTVLFVSATRAEVDMRTRFEAQQEARLAIDAIRREVHCATAITQTGPSDTVTMTLPTGCSSGSGTVTWCTVNLSAGRHQLYRQTGTTCDSTGRRYADYITVANVFSYSAATNESRAKLNVQFPVDIEPGDTIPTYSLVDDLVLRNSDFQ